MFRSALNFGTRPERSCSIFCTYEQVMGIRSRDHACDDSHLPASCSTGVVWGLVVSCEELKVAVMIALPPFVRDIVDPPFQGIQQLRNSQPRSWMLFHYV